MSKRRGQCCEPLTLLGTTFYCVEPVDHQCKHYFHFLESDVRRIAERATQAEADAAALRADIARHVAIAAEQATEIESLRALLRRWQDTYGISPKDGGVLYIDSLDANTARATGDG